MKPILNIITAVSRIENLYKIDYDLKTRIKDFEVRWYAIFDPHNLTSKIPSDIKFYHAEIYGKNLKDCSGAVQKNRALSLIEEGWVYALDDDNRIHPDFNKTLKEAIFFFPHAKGFAFSQAHWNGETRITIATDFRDTKDKSLDEIVGSIDAGLYVMHINLIKATKATYKEMFYDSDRYFFKEIFAPSKKSLVFIDKKATYHNALRFKYHPDGLLGHTKVPLVCGSGPYDIDYRIKEWKNYKVLTYKNTYQVLSYSGVNNLVKE